MYLRVVMHDAVSKNDCHLTLLHYTTQRLLTILRISRDILEESNDTESMEERHTLKQEMGKLIVDHLYLTKLGDKGGEPLDDKGTPDDEDVDYELRMRDIMVASNAAHLSIKKKLLETASAADTKPKPMEVASFASLTAKPKDDLAPMTLLQMKEDNLLYKSEKT